MHSPDAVAFVIDALNSLGSAYILTGSVASSAYGEPRSTLDADFVLEVKGDEMNRLRRMLESEFESEPQTSFETVTGKAQHRFRHRRTKFLIEVFEARFEDAHERSRFGRRTLASFAGKKTFFPTAEDVVVQKLRWFKQLRRTKDRDDVVKVILVQWNTLDWRYIQNWCQEHETLEILEKVRQKASKTRKG